LDKVEERFYTPGEIIYKGDIYDDGNSNALYFILKGNVELFYNS